MLQSTALLSDATYQKLLNRRAEMDRDPRLGPVGGVMMPIGPAPGDGPRVLWVGKAALGGPLTPTELSAQYWSALLPELLESYNSAFWRFIKQTMAAALRRHRPHEEPDMLRHIGWSNVVLIAKGARGNPGKRARDEQFDLCAKALSEAIATMKPSHVVMLNGDYANDIVSAATGLPMGEWDGIAPFPQDFQSREKCTESGKIRFFWTRHPQHLQGLGIFASVSDRLAQEL